ncbi:MAG: protoporphyrinogen oxidase [Salinivirgaceae bacterium]|nr:protoporphyrinogen oxidase [Salinivirgaceae bacterium]
MENKYDIIVLGAGLTGLTTSYYIHKSGKKVLVIDPNSHVGGVIQTDAKNGFLFEKGPNTGILGSVEIAELIEDLHPDCEIEVGNKIVDKRFILHNAKWQPLPAGLSQGVTTPLFSFKDKLRLLGEPFRKPGTNDNETLAELVKRRMGQSFLDYAIDPFILGVYAGDPSYLVPKYALPKLYNLEQDYGSFIGGAIKKKFIKTSERDKKATRKIFTIKGGLSKLADAIYKRIGEEKFILGATNIEVGKLDKGYSVKLFNANKEPLEFQSDKIITTTPAFQLENLLPFVEKDLIKDVQNVFYAPVVEVAIGFNKWEGVSLDGFGGLIPHKEKRDILGVMYMSSLFEGRAPEGGALISVFVGGARRPELTKLSDEKIKKLVEKEFKELMGVENFNPDLFEISHHNRAIPQYGKESKERFAAVKSIQKEYPGLFIGGNLYDGIGMADRVKQGKQMADFVINN